MIHLASPLAQYRAHDADIAAAIARVLNGGVYILGDEVENFERAFAAYCGVGDAAGVGNGTDALVLAIKALGIGHGDEVIAVSHTALATGAAILAAGAVPVLIDIDPVYYTIDPAQIEAAITPRTRAIVAVHIYGQAAEMDAIGAIAKRYGLPLVEDCAQAAGGRYGQKRIGSIGDIACFSFYPTKNLGAVGDGGMVVGNDQALISRVKQLRQYGWDASRQTREVGLNSRLDPLQAAILGAKLPHLDADNARRGAIAARYNDAFADLPLIVPALRAGTQHVFHLYVVALDNRDGLMAHLAARKIGAAVHYPVPVHGHGGYSERVRLPEGGLPVTARLVNRILSLPMYPELTDDEVGQVIAAVRGFFGKAA